MEETRPQPKLQMSNENTPMTTTNVQHQLTDEEKALFNKRLAWEARQQDTGWGMAAAHLLPFVGIYYAIKRRTVTPLLWSSLGTYAAAFSLGILMGLSGNDFNDKQYENAGTVVGLIACPLLAKKGIDKARKFAAKKLEDN